MTNHDYLSDRTRSFRKGVLTFSAFLVLAIAYDIKVTEIPALGIKDIDPSIVFFGNLIALLYLFVSYILYYIQDRAHHDGSNLISSLKTKETDRTKRYLSFVTDYIDKYFQNSIKGLEVDSYIVTSKGYILRAMMKENFDDKLTKESIKAIIKKINDHKGYLLSADKICNDLSDERNNYMSAKERSLKLVANQATADSIVSVWDFWLPVTSAILALILFKLKF